MSISQIFSVFLTLIWVPSLLRDKLNAYTSSLSEVRLVGPIFWFSEFNRKPTIKKLGRWAELSRGAACFVKFCNHNNIRGKHSSEQVLRKGKQFYVTYLNSVFIFIFRPFLRHWAYRASNFASPPHFNTARHARNNVKPQQEQHIGWFFFFSPTKERTKCNKTVILELLYTSC